MREIYGVNGRLTRDIGGEGDVSGRETNNRAMASMQLRHPQASGAEVGVDIQWKQSQIGEDTTWNRAQRGDEETA